MGENFSSVTNEAYYRIHADEGKLDHFWDRFDSRFESGPSLQQIRYLEIAGLSIKIECRSLRLLNYLDIQLASCLSLGSDKPDAVFRVWQDEIVSCLPSGCPMQKVLIMTDQLLAIKVEKDEGRLHGFDRRRNRGYFCLEDDSDSVIMEQGYLLYRLFYNLAKNTSRVMLHGAVIGYENKGVVICGSSGYGKSTLALSSLLEGCQYVGDDHSMFTRKEETTFSWPVYSIGSVYETTLNQLPRLQIGHRWLKNRALKDVFDVSVYHSQFCFGLPIKALIFPKISLEANEPSLTEIGSGRVLTHLIWSTINQVDDRKDPFHIRNILEFFKSLPSYSFVLCPDVDKNAKFLKHFISSFSVQK